MAARGIRWGQWRARRGSQEGLWAAQVCLHLVATSAWFLAGLAPWMEQSRAACSPEWRHLEATLQPAPPHFLASPPNVSPRPHFAFPFQAVSAVLRWRQGGAAPSGISVGGGSHSWGAGVQGGKRLLFLLPWLHLPVLSLLRPVFQGMPGLSLNRMEQTGVSRRARDLGFSGCGTTRSFEAVICCSLWRGAAGTSWP